jgi:hypothetical protein
MVGAIPCGRPRTLYETLLTESMGKLREILCYGAPLSIIVGVSRITSTLVHHDRFDRHIITKPCTIIVAVKR